MFITKEYLESHPNEIFVFGDNSIHRGKGGAAKLRDLPNTYGFITKKLPYTIPDAYYTQTTYAWVFEDEMKKFIQVIKDNPTKIFLISKLGAGLANRNGIFKKIIQPGLEVLKTFSNVKFLF